MNHKLWQEQDQIEQLKWKDSPRSTAGISRFPIRPRHVIAIDEYTKSGAEFPSCSWGGPGFPLEIPRLDTHRVEGSQFAHVVEHCQRTYHVEAPKIEGYRVPGR